MRYVASIAILFALLVAAPAKADVLGGFLGDAFGFPADRQVTEMLTFSWDGQNATITVYDPAALIVTPVSITGAQLIDEGGESVGGAWPGMSVLTAGNPFEAYYFGYSSSYYSSDEILDITQLGIAPIVGMLELDPNNPDDAMIFEVINMLPNFVPLSLIPMVGEMADMPYVMLDEGYLYVAELNSVLRDGGDMAIELAFGFSDEDWTLLPPEFPFTFTLYGIAPEAVADVPEPATLALVGLGLAGLGLARRRRK